MHTIAAVLEVNVIDHYLHSIDKPGFLKITKDLFEVVAVRLHYAARTGAAHF